MTCEQSTSELRRLAEVAGVAQYGTKSVLYRRLEFAGVVYFIQSATALVGLATWLPLSCEFRGLGGLLMGNRADTQESNKQEFEDGRQSRNHVDGTHRGNVNLETDPRMMLDVVKRDGRLYSNDNRRLYSLLEPIWDPAGTQLVAAFFFLHSVTLRRRC